MEQPPRVMRCPAELREAALRQLHAGLPDDQQAALAFALSALDPSDQAQWDGLFVAAAAVGGVSDHEDVIVGEVSDPADVRGVSNLKEASAGSNLLRRHANAASQTPPTGRSSGPTAAAWVQPMAGNTAVVWPPASDAVAAEPLLRAAAEFVDHREIHLAQLQLAADHAYPPAMLRRAGFEPLVDLIYMAADAARPAAAPSTVAGDLQFVPRALEQPDRLAAIVARTYEHTRDCPGLDGIRSMADVLAGYRAQGELLAEHWYVISAAGDDVGALILANHPAVGNWELVYMGVAPAARGRGFGEQIVRFALQAAAAGDAERLVLAVDAANEPALEVYRRAGFREWERRIVYARLRSTS